MGRVDDILFWKKKKQKQTNKKNKNKKKNQEFLKRSPLEIPKNCVWHPLKIPRSKTKTHENPT